LRNPIHEWDSAIPPSLDRRSEPRTGCQWRASIEGGTENPLPGSVLDLMRAAAGRARAYEERCDCNFRHYTPDDRCEQQGETEPDRRP
jgi:hypothetical protein